MSSPTKAEESHPVSLKVMRLTKPTLNFVMPFTCEAGDIVESVLTGGSNTYPYTPRGEKTSAAMDEQHRLCSSDALGITPFLSLPGSFGTAWRPRAHCVAIGCHSSLPHAHSRVRAGSIYLGETFSSYLSLNNHSPYAIDGVSVKGRQSTSTATHAHSGTANDVESQIQFAGHKRHANQHSVGIQLGPHSVARRQRGGHTHV